MKRPGKCVGKKKFSYWDDAERQVIKNYIYGLKSYGIYECPTCLDFHLTSKYDNRSPELKKYCRKARALSYAINDPVKASSQAQRKWKLPVALTVTKTKKRPRVVQKSVYAGSVSEALKSFNHPRCSWWVKLNNWFRLVVDNLLVKN